MNQPSKNENEDGSSETSDLSSDNLKIKNSTGELPPLDEPEESVVTGEGLTKPIKITIIVFSLVTLIAFAIFSMMMIKQIASPSKAQKEWGSQLLTVAEKLNDAGLKEEAIQQYEKFLENPKVGLPKRAEISYLIAKIYMDMGNCRDALIWLYQTEAADASFPNKIDLDNRIDGCLHQVKTPVSKIKPN